MAEEKHTNSERLAQMREEIVNAPIYQTPKELTYAKQLAELESFAQEIAKYPYEIQMQMAAAREKREEEARSAPSEILDGFLFLGSYESYRRAKPGEYSHIIKVTDKNHLDPTDKTFFQRPPAGTIHCDIGKDLRDKSGSWETLKARLPEAFKNLDQAFEAGTTVLVHCTEGVSRSAAVVIAYLIYKFHISFEQAHNYVLPRRPVVSTLFNQQLQTDELELQNMHLSSVVLEEHPRNAPEIPQDAAENEQKRSQPEDLTPEFIQWLSLNKRDERLAMRQMLDNPTLSTSEYWLNLSLEQRGEINAEYQATLDSTPDKIPKPQQKTVLQDMTIEFVKFFRKEGVNALNTLNTHVKSIGMNALNPDEHWANLSESDRQMFIQKYKEEYGGRSPFKGENSSPRLSFQNGGEKVNKQVCIIC